MRQKRAPVHANGRAAATVGGDWRTHVPTSIRGASRRARDPDERRLSLTARVARRVFACRFRLLHARRYGKVDLARVHGLSLLVLPGVFHPEFFFATDFFLGCLDQWKIRSDMHALDMGTGSGALAVALARRGALVTAVDVNPQAVRCAAANALLHGLEARMEVREGDLFAPLAERQFDLIVFNPPFYDRPARDMADRAWTAGTGSELVWRFLREAPAHLRADGELLIMGSTEAPYTSALRCLPGYSVRLVAHRELVSERLLLFALRPG